MACTGKHRAHTCSRSRAARSTAAPEAEAVAAAAAADDGEKSEAEVEVEAEAEEQAQEQPKEQAAAAAAAIQPTSGMAAVSAALTALGFAQYADKFAPEGYDELDWLKEKEPEQLEKIGLEIGMKAGHAKRFADWLERA